MAVAIGFTAALTAASPAGAETGALQPIEVDTASGPHAFKVEVAKSDADREKGLMYRRAMPKNQGMLFDFESGQRPLYFWMKNTYIALDMVFIDADGRVVSIKHDAKPMDESIISSEVPAKGVLEINAGQAKAIDLKVGDVVKHQMFHDVGH